MIEWAAGLIDGEGCLHIKKRNQSYAPRVEVAMTDEGILLDLQKLWGGRIHKRKPQQKRKQAWQWYLTDMVDVRHCLLAILPHLRGRNKSQEGKVLLEFIDFRLAELNGRKKMMKPSQTFLDRAERDYLEMKRLKTL